MKTFKPILISLLLITVCQACTGKVAHKDSEPGGPATAVQSKSYPGVGTVTALDPTSPTIEIDHEDIEGLMPAMQMKFHLKDKALLDGLTVGDRVSFTIENGVGGLRIIGIHKM